MTACGGGGSTGSGGNSSTEDGSGSSGSFTPKYYGAEFHEDSAEGNSEAKVDLSCTSDGYFGVLCNSDSKLKLQVLKDGDTFTYDITSGRPQIFPLQSGDGNYSIRVMENVSDDNYYELYSTNASVSLSNSNAPFLRPNIYADFSKSSKCVQEASKMAGSSGSESDFVNRVYEYVCDEIKYDYDKAENVTSGYVPDPDQILESGKGICFDYACVGASMLRSQGIPTKIIFGYVEPDDLYHAWNMFYTEADGWTTVEFSVTPGEWSRVDLTFSANGQDSDFIGDGSNYQDVYQY